MPPSVRNDQHQTRGHQGAEAAEQPEVVVEIDEATEVQRIVERIVLRMQANEPIDGGECQFAFPVLVMSPCDLDLRLLRPAPERVVRLEFLQQLDSPFIVGRGDFVLGLCI
jgi:hypothetical protein